MDAFGKKASAYRSPAAEHVEHVRLALLQVLARPGADARELPLLEPGPRRTEHARMVLPRRRLRQWHQRRLRFGGSPAMKRATSSGLAPLPALAEPAEISTAPRARKAQLEGAGAVSS